MSIIHLTRVWHLYSKKELLKTNKYYRQYSYIHSRKEVKKWLFPTKESH